MIGRPLLPREKKIFTVCLITVFIYIIYAGLYQPLKNNASELRGKVQVQEGKLKKNLKIIEKGKNYQTKFNSYMEQFKQTGSDEQVMSSILSEIDEVADGIDVQITQMKPNRVRRVDSFNNFSVVLTMNGTLTEITRFLYILQNDPYAFQVQEVRFDKISPRSSSLKCQLVLTRLLVL